jgi:hypothetical protein
MRETVCILVISVIAVVAFNGISVLTYKHTVLEPAAATVKAAVLLRVTPVTIAPAGTKTGVETQVEAVFEGTGRLVAIILCTKNSFAIIYVFT